MPAFAQSTTATDTSSASSVEQFLPLVPYVIRRMSAKYGGSFEFEDLVGYGRLGLLEAWKRYDPAHGVPFHAYAVRRIHGAVLDALRSQDELGRAGRHKARLMDRARDGLSQALGRNPSAAEVAQTLGISVDQYRRDAQDTGWKSVPLSVSPQSGGEELSLEEVIADPEARNDSERLEHRELVAALARAISRLPDREELIVTLHFRENLKLREIAQVLDISETRVSQLKSQALGRLRASLEVHRSDPASSRRLRAG